jgi:hypothetical protein
MRADDQERWAEFMAFFPPEEPRTFTINRHYTNDDGILVVVVNQGDLPEDQLREELITFGNMDGDEECLSADDIWGIVLVHPELTRRQAIQLAVQLYLDSK